MFGDQSTRDIAVEAQETAASVKGEIGQLAARVSAAEAQAADVKDRIDKAHALLADELKTIRGTITDMLGELEDHLTAVLHGGGAPAEPDAPMAGSERTGEPLAAVEAAE